MWAKPPDHSVDGEIIELIVMDRWLAQWFMLALQIKHSTMHCGFSDTAPSGWKRTRTVALSGYWGIHSRGVLKTAVKWCHQPSLLTSHAILPTKFCISPDGVFVWIRKRHLLCKGTRGHSLWGRAWSGFQTYSDLGTLWRKQPAWHPSAAALTKFPILLFLLLKNMPNMKFTASDM